MKPTWKPVVGWACLYEVSDHGLVRAQARAVRTRDPHGMWTIRRLRSKLLRQRPNRRGHMRVMLSVANADLPTTRLHAYVHTLVAEAFIGLRPKGTLVCHRDDCKRNNRVTNIYYGTRVDNAQDALRNGCHGTERRRRGK
jgi:hypothetical protein